MTTAPTRRRSPSSTKPPCERWFPAGDPLGKRVEVDTTYEVVGIVRDVRQEGLREPAASRSCTRRSR